MEKIIYDGPNVGVFSDDHFDKFYKRLLKRLGAEEVCFHWDIEYIYHLNPFGVTMRYVYTKKFGNTSRLILIGDEKAVGEVEKIINEEIRKSELAIKRL